MPIAWSGKKIFPSCFRVMFQHAFTAFPHSTASFQLIPKHSIKRLIGSSSSSRFQNAGVPQKQVLRPLLFFICNHAPNDSSANLTSVNTTSILMTSNFISLDQTLLWTLNSCVQLPIWYHHLDVSSASQLHTFKHNSDLIISVFSIILFLQLLKF